ncbi:MAG: hypothetical protein U0269_17735 [Polyangiales bacterium]
MRAVSLVKSSRAILGSLGLLLTIVGCSSEPMPMPDASGNDGGSSMDSTVNDSAVADTSVDTGVVEDTGVVPADSGAGSDADAAADAAPARCAAGVDSDGDGLTNDAECALMTDPYNPDTDMDGLSDGAEARYPRVCVATMPAMQRRPVVACSDMMPCRAGEMCRGLNPTARDTDGDGVSDFEEDPDANAMIDTSRGETDPRLIDSNGDGINDGMSGIAICRPSGLATLVQGGIPGGPTQLGYAPSWRNSGRVTGTMMRGGIALEDPTAGVAAFAAVVPSMGDITAESSRIEGIVTTALGAGVSPILIGRGLTTHEMNPAVTSTYRVARMTSASALRDSIVMPLVGAAAPPAMPAVGASTEFYVDITTVRRTMGASANFNDVVVAISPRASYDNPALTTATRSIDLVNTTAVAQNDKGLGFNCQTFTAAGPPQVDFIWTVDTSVSMDPHQQRIGNTASLFFTNMAAAGVDFRVLVLSAEGAGGFDFTRNNAVWVAGSAMNGANLLAYRVTVDPWAMMAGDTLAPYPIASGNFQVQIGEEPIAAAVRAHLALGPMAPASTHASWRLRPGATVAAFFVADETGANDDNRYFSMDMARWGATYAARLTSSTNYFRTNNILTFGMVNTPNPAVMCAPATSADMRRCVIVQNGGAYLDIARATDADATAAMARIVSAVAGAASQYRLTRAPITSTIKVRVRGMDVPRSRANGFDYDSVANSIVFYGPMYRPNMGDEVVVSYRLWQPCPSRGASCRTDSECCLPFVCNMGRCDRPCVNLNGTCVENSDCCSPNICVTGRCVPPTTCRPAGDVCMRNEDCCAPNSCSGGRCTPPPPCRPQGDTCTTGSDCCDRNCVSGRCAPPPCRTVGQSCSTASDCCDRNCIGNVCAPG